MMTETKKRRYIRAIGRRKTSRAQVHLFANGTGEILVNNGVFTKHFPHALSQMVVLSPLDEVGQREKIDISVKVNGGGPQGQAEAVRLGIARALVMLNENFRRPLRKKGYLTRDSRRRERKKPGLKGARRAPQWQKR